MAKTLPQRAQLVKFNLIDRIEEVSDTRLVAVKYVSLAEEYLADHFPTFPVLPGVLMLEAMTQAAGWLLHATIPVRQIHGHSQGSPQREIRELLWLRGIHSAWRWKPSNSLKLAVRSKPPGTVNGNNGRIGPVGTGVFQSRPATCAEDDERWIATDRAQSVTMGLLTQSANAVST